MAGKGAIFLSAQHNFLENTKPCPAALKVENMRKLLHIKIHWMKGLEVNKDNEEKLKLILGHLFQMSILSHT